MDDNQLKALYEEVSARLSSVNFDEIWPGFTPSPFALYTTDRMFFQDQLSDRPDHFIGNTSLDHEDQRIAIWNMDYSQIEGPDSLDRLAAHLVHEIFHAFQHQRGETRFPQDLDLLLYPQDQALIAWTRRDSAFLAGPCDDPDKRLASLAFVRAEKTRLSAGATADEYRAETAEGLAEYAGIKGLGQLNPRLAQVQIDQYRHFLLDDRYLFDIRRRCYFSGLLLALAAEEAGLTLVHDLSTQSTLWDLLAPEAIEVQPLGPEELEEASALMAGEETRRAALLADFQARFPRKRPVHSKIIGYDPMNLTRVDDWLISSHFLLLDEDPSCPLMGDRLLRMKKGDPQKVEAVYYGNG